MKIDYKQSEKNLQKFFRNAMMFSAPALAVFFYQLSIGVSFSEALPIALFFLYGLLADFFKKFGVKNGKR